MSLSGNMQHSICVGNVRYSVYVVRNFSILRGYHLTCGMLDAINFQMKSVLQRLKECKILSVISLLPSSLSHFSVLQDHVKSTL